VLDLDPPEDAGFDAVVAAAHLVHRALDDAGLAAAVKTSGAKGVHVLVPLAPGPSHEDVAGATRALAARAARLGPDVATTAFIRADRGGKVFVDSTRAGSSTIVAVYSPRVRPGLPISFPVSWDDLDHVVPGDFTVRTAPGLLGDADPWTDAMPAPQTLPDDLVAEGRTIPVARVQAMHEGKRRARAARSE
jgi:bifunctional non-homologous end joining protein LigD